MKKIIVFVFCILFAVSLSAGKKTCGPKSKACGNSCIALDKECHKETKGKKNCGPKSKACGDSCISLDKKCTKDAK